MLTAQELPLSDGTDNKEALLAYFIDEMMWFGSSIKTPEHAKACYERLKSKEAEFLGTNMEGVYWTTLSVELFHRAQIEAILQGNQDEAKAIFFEANKAAQKWQDKIWGNYILWITAYFAHDIAGLELVANRAWEYSSILRQLLSGLKTRRSIDYRMDSLPPV